MKPARSARLITAAIALSLALAAGGCRVAHPGISDGAVSGCFRSLPAAKTAVHDSHARLLGVHLLSADEVPGRLRTLLTVPGENDTSVCAIAFRGTFRPGQVAGALPSASGAYALVLVNSKKLSVLTSYVGDSLPKAMRGRFV